jgi:hypothetical protein
VLVLNLNKHPFLKFKIISIIINYIFFNATNIGGGRREEGGGYCLLIFQLNDASFTKSIYYCSLFGLVLEN